MMQDLLKALPDDTPITDICIVGDPVNCPFGYHVVAKTFDQDTDADLWKDGFFAKRITRYICYSKAPSMNVVQSVFVIGDKDPPPEGYTLITTVRDTDAQKATRKKCLCFKVVPRGMATEAVTDIIVLSKSGRPPEGFVMAGEVNSLHIGYKLAPITPQRRKSSDNQPPLPPLPYQMPSLNLPQPKPRLQNELSRSAQSSALDDVPFDINPKYRELLRLSDLALPNIKVKTASELYNEYFYSFQVEYQAQQN